MRKIFVVILLPALTVLAVFAQTTAAQSGFAPSANGPLTFANNYFISGDYVIAGAYGVNTTFVAIGGITYAVGTINVPDKNPGTNIPNPGITGATSVPAGAEIVAAMLYWQTVEKVGVTPGQPGSGQNGFFGPVVNGVPQFYPMSGATASQNTVSFSNGGCTGGSTGKVVRTYRANVRGFLPQDASGNVLANGTYKVRLPSTSSTTPITLGATLIIIYRILSPNVPLNSIVIYDGSYAPGNILLTMTQTVQGFYDAAHNPLSTVSRLTHIVGSGHSNKFETVYLGTNTTALTALPPLYASGQPFPGYYGSWDNTTWTLPDPNFPPIGNLNPVNGGDFSATTMVVPTTSQQGCVSWGAVIFSTTVQNTDGDGLLDAWKTKQGYCDASINEGSCTVGNPSTGWVDLTGAVLGTLVKPHPDVFVQLDYMCSILNQDGTCGTTNPYCSTLNADGTCNTTGGYSFDPRLTLDPADGRNAVQKVVDAFADLDASGQRLNLHQPINLHVIPTNAILEPTCTDDPKAGLCVFPNQPGVVGWPGGLVFLKNQLFDADEPTNLNDCATSPPPAGEDCVQRFQHGRKDSYHYALFAHTLGLPNWTLQAGTLTSVVQTGKTVTFKTSTPHGLAAYGGNDPCPNGRVTVASAITNPNLNGTFCVTITDPTTFTIQVANSTNFTYTFSTDPNLAVASGQADRVSGFSDVGGDNSVITLGSWGADGRTWQVKAGTFMHELGHSLGLTHGGFYFDKLSNNPPDYTPTIEANCKANQQSVMNYEFQIDLLDKFTGLDQNGNPMLTSIVDYSEQPLDTLSEGAPKSPALSTPATYYNTRWYALTSVVGGTQAPVHCDGTPLLNSDQPMSQVTLPATSLSWSLSTGEDINFDGALETVGVGVAPAVYGLRGHSDWTGTPMIPGVDLRQVGATGSWSTAGGGLQGGGGGLQGGGGGLQGGGGGLQGGGGGLGELSHATANSVTRPPRNLTASEAQSPRTITLNWTQPTFGQIVAYNVYRSENGGAFMVINAANTNPPHTVIGNPPATMFADHVTCDSGGFRYFVTAVVISDITNQEQESVKSNTVSSIPPSSDPLTGCYALTGFSSPGAGASAIQGSMVPITWTVQDDFYPTGFTAANFNTTSGNSLVAIGPIPHDGACPQTVPQPLPIGATVTTLSTAGSGVVFGANQFTFMWNTTTFNAGCYFFKLNLDSGQSETTTAFQLLIFVSDSAPYMTTTSLPDGVVGSAYSNTLQEAGGIAPFNWTVVSGALPPGTMLGAPSGTISGTPTAPGIYTFTAQITDANGNFSQPTQLTLRVADALFGDLIVVDGSPSANPLSGTLFRITATGTPGTIAIILNGNPTGVAVDPNTGNIFVAVTLFGTRIVEVTRFGTVSDFVPGGVFINPVAVAVDKSGNVYVGDNSTDKIYKFNSLGAQVDANGTPTVNPFASLPSSLNVLQDIRMAFDSAGNLIVASDDIGDFSGVVEVDKIDPTGTVTVLYNTTTNSSLMPAIMSVGGIAVFADGSIDVADFSAQAIYKITNPGAANMMTSTAVNSATGGLCCNISGMANPPSAVNTTLYVTLNGLSNGPRLQLAVPETNSVNTVLSGAPLTFPKDVAWYDFPPQ